MTSIKERIREHTENHILYDIYTNQNLPSKIIIKYFWADYHDTIADIVYRPIQTTIENQIKAPEKETMKNNLSYIQSKLVKLSHDQVLDITSLQIFNQVHNSVSTTISRDIDELHDIYIRYGVGFNPKIKYNLINHTLKALQK